MTSEDEDDDHERGRRARTRVIARTTREDDCEGEGDVVEEQDDDEVRPFDPRQDPRGFRARLRAELHALVKALSEQDFGEAVAHLRVIDDDTWDAKRVENAVEPFFAEYDKIIFDHHARNPQLSLIESEGPHFRVRQVLLDEQDHNEWFIEGEVRVDGSLRPEEPLFTLRSIRC